MRKYWPHFVLYALLIGSCIPLMAGWVPPNPWYGFRLEPGVPPAEPWYLINAMGARLFLIPLVAGMAVTAYIVWQGPEKLRGYLTWINLTIIFTGFWLVSMQLTDAFL